MSGPSWRLLAAAPFVCWVGCSYALVDCPEQMTAPSHTYLLVEYRAGAVVGTTPAPEVQETPSYVENRERTHTIALKFPDSCRTEGAATATGTSTTSSGIMGTNCGVWLAELERALTEQHYKVISWSALRQQQDTKAVSTYEAARTLGADVVLVVNSMETHTIERGASQGASYRYFTSNMRGESIEKYAPNEVDRPWLKTFASSHAGSILTNKDIVGLGATLDPREGQPTPEGEGLRLPPPPAKPCPSADDGGPVDELPVLRAELGCSLSSAVPSRRRMCAAAADRKSVV